MERRIFCTVCLILGILLPRLQISWDIIIISAVFCFVLWREQLRSPLSIGLIALCLVVGITRCLWDLHQPIPKLKGRGRIVGTILESPRRWGNSSVFFFEVHELNAERINEPFKVLVQWRECEQSVAPGDVWELSGRFVLGWRAAYPGAFDLQEWLWSQGAVSTFLTDKFDHYLYIAPPQGWSLYQLSYRAREYMMQNLEGVQDPEARALVAGVVFGETQSLPKELQDCFRRTGTSHLLAASGMNVALLAALILGLGKLLGYGPWRVAPLAIPLVIGYAFLAGCAPSITRAAAGTSLALFALWLGRTNSGWNTLCLSVWALLLWDPRQIYDLGFQLSVVAVVGLMASPTPAKKFGSIGSAITLTCSASIVTLPFFWSSFGELSTTLVIANLVLGPIVELLFPLGLLAGIYPLKPLVWLNEIIAKLSLLIVKWFSTLSDPLPLTQPTWPVWLGMLVAICIWLSPTPWRTRVLAWPMLALTLILSYYTSPKINDETVILRRIGLSKPIYWLSKQNEELLVLSAEWQRKRALQMTRKLGCSREPEVLLLDEAEIFDFRWGRFQWRNVEPLLQGASFTSIEIRAQLYTPTYWNPPPSPFHHSFSSSE